MSAARTPVPAPVCAPLPARRCRCERPLTYGDSEAWGTERHCAKCGRELAGTALRRRLQQVVFEAAHPGEAALADETLPIDLTTSAPAPATHRPSPAAGALAPTGRVASSPGGPAHPSPTTRPTTEGGHSANHQLIS